MQMNRSSFLILGLAASMAMPVAAIAQTSNGQTTDQPAGTTSVTDKTPTKKAKAPKPTKDEKVVQSKDTKQQMRKTQKVSKKDPLAGLDKDSPDKQLYDKGLAAIKSGRYEI